MTQKRYFTEAFKIRDIRYFIGGVAFFTFASRALAVVIGFQIYQLTNSVAALGWLGLVEAIPAISLFALGGHIADHLNRRKILLITRGASFLCAVALAILSWQHYQNSVVSLYFVIFLVGIARAFAEPASAALEAQVVPKHLTVNASSWISSTWVACSVIGPASIGFVFDARGAGGSYFLIGFFFLMSWVMTLLIAPKPNPVLEHRESIFKSISMGWKFVFSHQPLYSALALDLFAVFFGGAIALLPVYAKDILNVGAKGLGFLNAAPSLGSLFVMLWATHKAPIARAGRNLLLTVAGFGVSILVFAFSQNFWISMVALFFSGVFDGVSMVIRRSMIRLLTPDYIRGRVAAANSVFISASNELGAFESGMLASWIGTVPCVAVGGVLTLFIVATTSILAPQLRNLRFDPHTLEHKKI